MGVYLKQFENHTQYESFTVDTENFITPNISLCVQENEVHYNPWVETRVVAKFNVTNTSNPTKIAYGISNFSEIEIDGVVQQSVVSAYTFDTVGEHTVKYTLKNPTSIDNQVFSSCSGLTSIDIPDSVTSIGNYAFYQCTGLTSIDIPDSVTSIGSYAFRECSSLTSIDIPSGVTSIGGATFFGCSSLTSIDIPSGVTNIGNSAFAICSGLTSIVIPDSVTSIGNQAFYYCTSLTSIVPNAITAPTIKYDTFQSVKSGGILTVPQGSSGYDVWMNYLNNWTKVEQ